MQMTSLGTSVCCICQAFDKKWEYSAAVRQLFMDVPTAYDAVGRVIRTIFSWSLVYPLYTYQ